MSQGVSGPGKKELFRLSRRKKIVAKIWGNVRAFSQLGIPTSWQSRIFQSVSQSVLFSCCWAVSCSFLKNAFGSDYYIMSAVPSTWANSTTTVATVTEYTSGWICHAIKCVELFLFWRKKVFLQFEQKARSLSSSWLQRLLSLFLLEGINSKACGTGLYIINRNGTCFFAGSISILFFHLFSYKNFYFYFFLEQRK